MKQILLSILTVIATITVKAQCNPDTTFTQTGIYPPGATSWDPSQPALMPNAMESKSYSEVVNIKSPKDTTVVVGGIPINVTIDSLVFNTITGLPTSMSYQCDNSRCFWAGGDNGCFTISGTPTSGEAGTYNIQIEALGWADIGAGPQSQIILFDLKLEVDPFIGINEDLIAESFKIVPNPIRSSATVSFKASTENVYSFKVVDVTGRTVIEKSGYTEVGNNALKFNRQDLPEGVYIYVLESGDFRKSGRLIFSN